MQHTVSIASKFYYYSNKLEELEDIWEKKLIKVANLVDTQAVTFIYRDS